MRIAEFCYCLGLTRYSGTRANFLRATRGAPTPSSATPPATGQVRVSGKKGGLPGEDRKTLLLPWFDQVFGD